MSTFEKKLRRYAVIQKHRELVRSGEERVAAFLFRLLLNGRVSCGLSDDAFNAGLVLERLGFKPQTSRTGNLDHFKLAGVK